MYVTIPLSLYRKDPSALLLPQPDGPNFGVLVIQDGEAQPICCFGFCNNNQVTDIPFPQNKNLLAWYTTTNGLNSYNAYFPILFIPVLNQPLSSNLYYVIHRHGKHKGKALINSKEEDKTACCFCSCISYKKPEAFDWSDTYQQFEICKKGSIGYVAKCIAEDRYPPDFLRLSGWGVTTSGKDEFLLNEAPGLDAKLCHRFPDFNFPLSATNSTSVVVGKWYTPFIFIKEGSLKDQVNDSRYYEITLDQRWEKIFGCKNSNNANSVTVDVAVGGKEVTIDGRLGGTWLMG